MPNLDNIRYFNYFSGYVPSGEIFRMASDDIMRIARENKGGNSNGRYEICLIGLVSYFEAFVKEQLSSSISIAPTIIGRLREAGISTDISAEHAIDAGDDLRYRIGFLIGESLDLGTSRKINLAYTTALKITPFGKNGIIEFDRLLRDRNLIVHHGGVYTTAYIRQAFTEIDPNRRRAHADSLQIKFEQIERAATFLKDTARKTINASCAKLREMLDGEATPYSEEQEQAISAMGWWSEEDDEDKA